MSTSTTPRTDAAIIAADGRWTYELKEEMQAMERELNAANELIRILQQAHKQDLDDAIALAQQHLNSYHEAKERIRLLEEWIGDLNVIGSHSGKHNRREWLGEIGWLRPGQVAYVGEKKP